jgi:hypothetical protein
VLAGPIIAAGVPLAISPGEPRTSPGAVTRLAESPAPRATALKLGPTPLCVHQLRWRFLPSTFVSKKVYCDPNNLVRDAYIK